MKILTITTHFANNYGALLQSYALCRYLNETEDVECKILNYLPSGPQNYKSSWTIFHKPKSFRELLKTIYLMFRIDKYKERKHKNGIMRAFIKENLPHTTTKIFKSTIHRQKIEADAVICGSDQIWNRDIFTDTAYFLDFVPDGILRIAYAPSIATPWKEKDSLLIKKMLERFDSISIREAANYDQVKRLVPSKSVSVVCDPIFLLSPEIWESCAIKPRFTEPYIFCYFLGTSDLAVRTVQKIRLLTGLKVIHLNINALDKFNSDYVISEAGPFDFVGLIIHAEYVCTNSFHCSAFSIHFRKNLFTIPNSKRNERLQNLEEQFHVKVVVSEGNYDTITMENLTTDYELLNRDGEKYIKDSKSYIINALKKC